MTCCYPYTTYPWENVSSFCYNFQYINNISTIICDDNSCDQASYGTSSSYSSSSLLLDLFIIEEQHHTQQEEEYSTIMTSTDEVNKNESIFNNNTTMKFDDNYDENDTDSDYTYYKIRGGDDEIGPLYNYDVTCGNSLRGLVCTSYDKDRADRFNSDISYSLEFSYIPLSDVIKYDTITNTIYYDWITNFHHLLKECKQRNVQLIPRFYIHYPGHSKLSLPDSISKQIETRNYSDFNGGMSPYYGDVFLLNIIHDFIVEFGKQYDGNNYIAFIQCGLLGFWGEWHTMDNNFLPDSSKILVLQWYKQSFTITKIQTRYPFHISSITKTIDNDLSNYFGYHDDSYTYSTLDGYYNNNDNNNIENEETNIISWFFWRQVIISNETKFWIHSPMGGELRPETINDIIGLEYILNPITTGKQYKQSFYDCLRITHTTYMNCPIFTTPPPSLLSQPNISTTVTTNNVEEIFKQNQQQQQQQHDHLWTRIVQHARYLHGRMGYSFQIPSVTFRRRRCQTTKDEIDQQDPTNESFNMFDLLVTVEQIGVAPFYYPLSLVVLFVYTNENNENGTVCTSTINCEKNNTNICTDDDDNNNNDSSINNRIISIATTCMQNEGEDVANTSQSSSSSSSKSNQGFVDCNKREVQHKLVLHGIETIKEQYEQKTFTFSNIPLEWIEEISTISNLGNESRHHHSSNKKVSIQFSLQSSHLLSKQSIKFAQGKDGSVVLHNILPSKMWK